MVIRALGGLLVGIMIGCAGVVTNANVWPQRGQSPEQRQQDIAACYRYSVAVGPPVPRNRDILPGRWGVAQVAGGLIELIILDAITVSRAIPNPAGYAECLRARGYEVD